MIEYPRRQSFRSWRDDRVARVNLAWVCGTIGS